MAKRSAMILVTILFSLAAGILILLLVWSPGSLRPVVDAEGAVVPGSLSEKITVPINGVDQGMIIKSTHPDNPVLLYLHGGMPDYFLTQDYPSGLEELFTIVWWDQRGSGLSFQPDHAGQALTPEQIIADTISLTHYLQARFGQDRIYLMGHSGGTFIGIQVAARAPENYHAYIAVAQMTNQLASERLAYDHMVRAFRERGDTRMADRIAAAPPPDTVPLSDAYMSVRDVAMHRLGVGTMRNMTSIARDLFLRSLQNREYTLGEKLKLWRGKFYSGSYLWNTQLSTDLTVLVPGVEIPVYFIHGNHDYTVSYPLARRYFDEIDAPLKRFYSFQNSAHSPLFEEPERMRMIMKQDVLQGARPQQN